MNVAFIPVRGGSRSIPLKNIKEMAGHPLVYWTAKAAQECADIDAVYVATDSGAIRDAVGSLGLSKVRLVGRSAETATDEASTESVMTEFARSHEFDNIVLIQATSPLLTAEDLEGGFREYRKEGTDSVLSVVRQKRFVWGEDGTGKVRPSNYEVGSRPRRQEFGGFLVENGAFYITSREGLLESGCRLFGRTGAYEMPEDTYFEIDEPGDWVIVEEQLKRRLGAVKDPLADRLAGIRMFLTDCDGCLTDGGMYYSENGDELKKFNARDGHAFQMLRERGIITGIITGEDRKLNRRRAEKLGLDEAVQDASDKAGAIRELCRRYGIPLENVLYIGDDLNDLEGIRAAGVGCCPADAVGEVRKAADCVTGAPGGRGAVREAAEMVLRAKGRDR